VCSVVKNLPLTNSVVVVVGDMIASGENKMKDKNERSASDVQAGAAAAKISRYDRAKQTAIYKLVRAAVGVGGEWNESEEFESETPRS
jgi:hypothetical protein